MDKQEEDLNEMRRLSKMSKTEIEEHFKSPLLKKFEPQPTERKINLQDAMVAVDEWLKSDDTFVTDKNGNKIKDGLIDCKKGALLHRFIGKMTGIKNNSNPNCKSKCENVYQRKSGILKCKDCGKVFY